MNEIFREQYRETQALELARLKADRAGQVVPPRSSPPRTQSGALPGTTSAVPVTTQTPLPPITSLLGMGATDTVTQGDSATQQSTVVTETVDTTAAAQTETPAAQTLRPRSTDSRARAVATRHGGTGDSGDASRPGARDCNADTACRAGDGSRRPAAPS